MDFTSVLLVNISVWLAFWKVAASVQLCDFENGATLCGYSQDTEDDFDWRTRQGETPTPGTGPSFDHTLGANSTGHYMYIEASGPGIWDMARFISPTHGPSPAFCLRFFYHMFGEDTGRLSVRLRSGTGQLAAEALWTLKGNQGNQWIEAVVDGSSASDFEIAFEGKRGEGFKSDIAIDDISMAFGTTCDGIVVTQPPTYMPVTSVDSTSNTVQPISARKTDPAPTVSKQQGNAISKQPTKDVTSTLLEPIDSRLVIVVLAVGLSFWSVVFSVLAIVIYKTRQSRRCKKDNVTYDAIDELTNRERVAMAVEADQGREQSYA